MNYARLGSKKRKISAGTLDSIGVGTGVFTNMLGAYMQNSQMRKARQQQLNQVFEEEKLEDTDILENYNKNGEYINYLENGGSMNTTSSIKGKYATRGGKLKPIADGLEEVEGNEHGENKIDNSYGVTLFEQGNPVAEVEDGETISEENYVFSDRLKADKKHTFAKKSILLGKKRNKIEEKLERTNDIKSRNGYERMLAGFNMAEEVLKMQQEEVKVKEGNQELNKLASGGKIIDPIKDGNPNPNTTPIKIDKNTLSKTNVTNLNSEEPVGRYLPIRGIQKGVTNSKGKEGMYIFHDKTPLDEGFDINTNREFVYNTALQDIKTSKAWEIYQKELNEQIQTDKNNKEPIYSYTNLKSTNKMANGGDIQDTKEDIEEDSFWKDLSPNLLDNVTNLGLTLTSPKLAKPILNRAKKLKTNINVNNQVAAVNNAVNSNRDNINSNTSNSNIARANIASLKLRGAEQLGNIYTNKENVETQLKNQDSMNRQQVSMRNNEILTNKQNMDFARANDIQSRLSANVADLSKNIGEAQNRGDMREYYNEAMLLELLDDQTGSKAKVMARNPYFTKSKRLRKALEIENKRLNR